MLAAISTGGGRRLQEWSDGPSFPTCREPRRGVGRFEQLHIDQPIDWTHYLKFKVCAGEMSISSKNMLGPQAVMATSPLEHPELALIEATRLARLGLFLFDQMFIVNIGIHMNVDGPSIRLLPYGSAVSADPGDDDVVEGSLFSPAIPIADEAYHSLAELLYSGRRLPDHLREYVEDLRTLADERLFVTDALELSPDCPNDVDLISLVSDDPSLDEFLRQYRAGRPREELLETFGEALDRFKGDLARSLFVTYWGMFLHDVAREGRVVAFTEQPSTTVMGALGNSNMKVGDAFNSEWLGARLLLAAVPGILDLRVPDLLELRETLAAPVARFRSAVSQVIRSPHPVSSEEELVRYWVETVEPELAELNELVRQQSFLRRLLVDLDSSDVLAASAGMYVAASAPSEVLRAISLGLPLGLRVAKSQVAYWRSRTELSATRPYFLLHELRSRTRPRIR